MRQGFASLLVLVLAGALLSLHESQNQIQNQFDQTQNAVLAAQKNAFWRETLENSTDKIIENALENELLQPQPSAEHLQSEIVQNLLRFIQQIEEQNPEIQFFIITTNPAEYANALSAPREPVSYPILNETTKAYLVQEHGALFAVFAVTGGKNQNQTLFAKIDFGKHVDFFLLPLGYTQTKAGIR